VKPCTGTLDQVNISFSLLKLFYALLLLQLHDERTVIGKTLFKKETKIQAFLGLKVQLSTGETGIIEGAFGTTGKFRVSIPGTQPHTQALTHTLMYILAIAGFACF